MAYSPFYFIGQAFKNIWRNVGMSIASVLILMACLLVTGAFYSVERNINYNLEGLGGLNKILVYINEECTEDQIRKIKEEAENCKGALEVTLITKEEALKDEKDKMGEEFSDIFEWLEEGENPYRASLEIEYETDSDVAALEKALKNIDGVDKIVSRSDTAEKVEQIKDVVSKVFLGMMVLLFTVSVFVIITSIRLALSARKKEIVVMRYVGATGFFITVPFLLEGALLGLAASLAAFGVQYYIYGAVFSGVSENFLGLLNLLPASALSGTLFKSFLAIGLVTGLLGSTVSLAKYLNK